MIIEDKNMLFSSPGQLLRIGFLNHISLIFGAVKFIFAEEEFHRLYNEFLFDDNFNVELCQNYINYLHNADNNDDDSDLFGPTSISVSFRIDADREYFFSNAVHAEEESSLIKLQARYEPYHIRKNNKIFNRERLESGNFSVNLETTWFKDLENVIAKIYDEINPQEEENFVSAMTDCLVIDSYIDSSCAIEFDDLYQYASHLAPQIKLCLSADEELSEKFYVALRSYYDHHRFWRYNGHTPLEIEKK